MPGEYAAVVWPPGLFVGKILVFPSREGMGFFIGEIWAGNTKTRNKIAHCILFHCGELDYEKAQQGTGDLNEAFAQNSHLASWRAGFLEADRKFMNMLAASGFREDNGKRGRRDD
jgi:hypothetical protein